MRRDKPALSLATSATLPVRAQTLQGRIRPRNAARSQHPAHPKLAKDGACIANAMACTTAYIFSALLLKTSLFLFVAV